MFTFLHRERERERVQQQSVSAQRARERLSNGMPACLPCAQLSLYCCRRCRRCRCRCCVLSVERPYAVSCVALLYLCVRVANKRAAEASAPGQVAQRIFVVCDKKCKLCARRRLNQTISKRFRFPLTNIELLHQCACVCECERLKVGSKLCKT